MALMSGPSEFHDLLNAAPDAMVVVDRHGRMTALNLEAERFFGWPEEELLRQPMSRVIPNRFQRLLDADIEPKRGSDTTWTGSETVSCFARRRDGSEFPIELSRRTLGRGRNAQSLVTLRDRSEWSRAEKSRSRNNEQARAILESIGDSVVTTDVYGRITYLNPVAERLSGWTADEARGQSLEAVLPLVAEASRQPVTNTAVRCLQEGRSIDLENGVLLLRRDGTEIPIGDSAAPVRDRLGGVIGVVIVIQDESEKRRVGHRLSYEATHDALTGLVNRREFERRLTNVVASLGGAPSEHLMLYLDLDRFKPVNDSGGHEAGDALLRGLSSLFSRCLRRRDTLARLGGDEFGILLENCPLVEAERIAEKLRAEVERYRFEWGDRDFSIGVSIGLLAVTAQSGGTPDMLRAADAACYAAKVAGGNRVHLEPSGRDTAHPPEANGGSITRLARAADEGQFRLYAQPIVPLQSERSARPRFEVLLRLPDEHGRMQPAARFLPHAERCNLMPAIDRWVVRETIALLGQWRREHPDAELPVCSINLSASALADDGLVAVLDQQLARYGITPDAFCFEIAESAALADLGRTVRFLSGLRSTGCGMALDDVGNGVTSLTYLKTLPVDYLKIGGRFVREVAADPMYASIISAVDQIGRSMGMFTIAKHVGSEQSLERLRALGISYAQGHALTSPAPLTDGDGRVMMRDLLRSA
jgi:diguanylate cyclase (GGDEF)-like protein/PAS domain S-box-containing protein